MCGKENSKFPKFSGKYKKKWKKKTTNKKLKKIEGKIYENVTKIGASNLNTLTVMLITQISIVRGWKSFQKSRSLCYSKKKTTRVNKLLSKTSETKETKININTQTKQRKQRKNIRQVKDLWHCKNKNK